VVGGAQRAAARVRHRAEARRAVGDHHADVARALALDADSPAAWNTWPRERSPTSRRCEACWRSSPASSC
jgi:hypothetical protein